MVGEPLTRRFRACMEDCNFRLRETDYKEKLEGSSGNVESHLSGLVVLDMYSRLSLLKVEDFASAEPQPVPGR
uniref:Uncharacterized protein n=1 Tax=Cannabis sativa TaxID=3483 RepID=A0A803QE95_CANSA